MKVEPVGYPGAQAVSRAIALLKSFNDSNPEWQLTELAKIIGLNRSTAYRLLSTLEQEGLLTRQPNSRTYCLGPELIALGGCALRSNDLRTVARPVVQSLAETTGEAATLEILSGQQVVVIDETSGQHLVGMSQDVGTRLPLHATSTGKVLLAYSELDFIDEMLSSPLIKVTDRTVISADRLRDELDSIRRSGYTVAVDELEIGFVAIAAPIFNVEDMVIAAISIGGPSSRLTPDRVESAAQIVVDAAQRLSRQLGSRAS